MTELQEARAKWLDAETRALQLQSEVTRLQRANYELQSQVITLSAQSSIWEIGYRNMTSAMLGVPVNGGAPQ